MQAINNHDRKILNSGLKNKLTTRRIEPERLAKAKSGFYRGTTNDWSGFIKTVGQDFCDNHVKF